MNASKINELFRRLRRSPAWRRGHSPYDHRTGRDGLFVAWMRAAMSRGYTHDQCVYTQ